MGQAELERKVRGMCGEGCDPLFRAMERLEHSDKLDELIAAVPPGPRH